MNDERTGRISVGHATENQTVLMQAGGVGHIMLAGDAIDLGCSLIKAALASLTPVLDEHELADAMRTLDIVTHWHNVLHANAGGSDE
jgi:hypothetical protein